MIFSGSAPFLTAIWNLSQAGLRGFAPSRLGYTRQRRSKSSSRARIHSFLVSFLVFSSKKEREVHIPGSVVPVEFPAAFFAANFFRRFRSRSYARRRSAT